MKYAIARKSFEQIVEIFGDYNDKAEAENNTELLNKVDPFNDYEVIEHESYY